MNRMEEYQKMMQELEEPVSELEDTFTRAYKKVNRRRRIVRSVMGTAAVFAMFVILVNVSAPVAHACSRIPILKELTQTEREVEASVKYLIVDQKQVNVFFTLDSDVYAQMNAEPKILSADGDSPAPCSYTVNGWDAPNGELRSITIDFVDENVPNRLLLELDVRNIGISNNGNEVELSETDVEKEFFESSDIADEEYVARFEFLLEFDPEFTATGKYYEINETVVLEEQKIIIRDVEIFPTHMRVNVEDMLENAAWLKSLEFYIETDDGMKIEPVSGGIKATGSEDTPTMVSFRADSSYFYEAENLNSHLRYF